MKHRARSAAVALIVVAMVVTFGSSANAEESTQSSTTSDVRATPPEPADPETSTEILLEASAEIPPEAFAEVPLAPGESPAPLRMKAQQVSVGASPARCAGKTDHAHKSGSNSSVHGRTKCSRSVEEVGVTTHLWNGQWWGWNLLRSDSSSRRWANNSKDATPHYPCSTSDINSFFGSSDHHSVENGRVYRASTQSPIQRFGC